MNEYELLNDEATKIAREYLPPTYTIDVVTILVIIEVLVSLAKGCGIFKRSATSMIEACKDPSLLQKAIVRQYVRNAASARGVRVDDTKALADAILKRGASATPEELEKVLAAAETYDQK